MKIGNLFELAENQLIKERKDGIIPCYTFTDVLEYAVKIRSWLDKNGNSKVRKITKLTPQEIKKKNRQYRMNNYYAKLNK